jgi:hypothetical protein
MTWIKKKGERDVYPTGMIATGTGVITNQL